MTLETGQPAPDFTLPVVKPSGDEETLQLSTLQGKNVVLYFYPKDNTPGCTTESKDFSCLLGAFDKEDTVILGLSKDSIRKHINFINKQELTLQLVSDEEGLATESYGVWVEKSMYGRKYMGIERSTFLIDKKGLIQRVWRKVKVKGHAEAVLKAVQELNNA